MQVAVETTEGLQRRMTVDLPEERIADEVDSRLKSMLQNARIPGFRPGKVPRKVIEKRYGKAVRAEVVQEVLQSSFFDAVTGENLRPAGGPEIDPIEAEPGQGLKYTAVFEVYPDVELADLEELEISRPVAEVEDANIDRMIEVLRKQRMTWSEVERPAAEGDRLTVDYVGRIDGEEFDGGKAEGFSIEIGNSRLIEGFDTGLIGTGAGSTTDLNLKFPDEYGVEDLAGKDVVFSVTVHKVEAGELPEIDEAFIQQFGVEDGSLEAFRGDIRSNMERELESTIKNQTKERVLTALLEKNPIEVPNALIEEEMRRVAESKMQELRMYGIDPTGQQLDPELFRDEATRRVQLGLLLAEAISASGLQADPDRVRAQVESIASTYEDPNQVINWFYGDPSRLQQFESQVLEEMAIDSILEKAQVSDEQTNFDDLINPGGMPA
jgi:trigger factor